ncbi:hypothetical protein VN1261_14830 [Helicobacter pylori]|nr:hypothetical protein VN1261_14830 [Helicobacter pylori]
MKESIPRHAREVTDNLIKSEEKSIQSIQAKLAKTTQDISKKNYQSIREQEKHDGGGFEIWRKFHSAI